MGGKVIVGETVAITEQAVQLKDGREVPYDHLVFAVGSLNGGAAGKGSDITLQDRKNTLKVGVVCACLMECRAEGLSSAPRLQGCPAVHAVCCCTACRWPPVLFSFIW